VPIAVCEAVESLGGRSCAIKWPNDVWIEERKVAGVLIEARPPEWAVIGIGVNVAIEPDEFPADLRWPATSIGGEATLEATRRAVCAALDRWAPAPREEVIAAFRERDALAGRRVDWEDGSGTAQGVDDQGNLVVRLDDGGAVALGSGEVSLRVG
jgi:BirA family biotin operon repressor/biotin-[acetyl-CoA-carboxylase] ligase